MTRATPWPAMLATARELQIAPYQFWRLSLREWRAIIATRVDDDAMHRTTFDRLARQFPDGTR